MDETSKSAAGVSVLADGLAVSHYVEALEARTPRSPRKTGQAPREVASDVQDVTEAQGTAPDSPPKAEDPLQFGADLELELDSLEAAGPRIALPAPAERADRTDAEQEASPNDFCLSPVAGTGYAAAGFTSLHSLSADLSPVAWARRDEEFQFSPVVLESLAGVQETDPPSETADASAQPPRLHALTPCNVGSAAKASRNSRLRSLTPPTQREAERVAATNDDADGSSDSEVLELVETVRNRATTWSHEAHKSIMEKLGIQLHEGADVSSPRATFQVRRGSAMV